MLFPFPDSMWTPDHRSLPVKVHLIIETVAGKRPNPVVDTAYFVLNLFAWVKLNMKAKLGCNQHI